MARLVTASASSSSLLTTSLETQWVRGRLFLLATPASVGSPSLRGCTLHAIASTFRGVAHGVRQSGGGVANSLSEATNYLLCSACA